MIFSILTNFQHLKFTAHEDMRDLTDGEPRNRRTDTRTNYCMPTVHRAPRHNKAGCCIRLAQDAEKAGTTGTDKYMQLLEYFMIFKSVSLPQIRQTAKINSLPDFPAIRYMGCGCFVSGRQCDIKGCINYSDS